MVFIGRILLVRGVKARFLRLASNETTMNPAGNASSLALAQMVEMYIVNVDYRLVGFV